MINRYKFCEIIDGEVTKYFIDHPGWLNDNGDLLSVEELIPHGVFPVVFGIEPENIPMDGGLPTHIAIPEYSVGDNEVIESFELYEIEGSTESKILYEYTINYGFSLDADLKQVSNYYILRKRSIQELRDVIAAKIELKRDYEIFRDYEFTINGSTFKIQLRNQNDYFNLLSNGLDAVYDVASNNSEAPHFYRSAENTTIELTASQLASILKDLKTTRYAAFVESWALKEQLDVIIANPDELPEDDVEASLLSFYTQQVVG